MTSKYTEIEIYKPITYNSYTAARYEVSNLGRVRNRRNGRILTNVARPAYASVILQISKNLFMFTFWLPSHFSQIRKGFLKSITKTRTRWIRDSPTWNGAIGVTT